MPDPTLLLPHTAPTRREKHRVGSPPRAVANRAEHSHQASCRTGESALHRSGASFWGSKRNFTTRGWESAAAMVAKETMRLSSQNRIFTHQQHPKPGSGFLLLCEINNLQEAYLQAIGSVDPMDQPTLETAIQPSPRMPRKPARMPVGALSGAGTTLTPSQRLPGLESRPIAL